MKAYILSVVLFLVLSVFNQICATGSFWSDIDFVQQKYTETGNLKCSVNLEYFKDYTAKRKDYGINACMIVGQDKYYSKLGTIEMIINANRGLMIDHSKKYALLSTPQKLNKARPDAITMTDIKLMMDSSKRKIDTSYVLWENDSLRTYYIGFKPGNYYKFMHFSFNKKTGMINFVEYFMQFKELEKLGKVIITYSSTHSLTNADRDLVNLDNYVLKGKPAKLVPAYRNYELVIDDGK